MDKSVKANLRYEFALEHAVPVGYGELAGKDQCSSVIPVVNYLLKVMLSLPLQSGHSEIIDNEQVVRGEFAKEIALASFKVGQSQALDERAHGEVKGLDPLATGAVSQCAGEKGFPGSGRSSVDDYGSSVVDVVSGVEFCDGGGGQALHGVGFQLLQRSLESESRILEEPRHAVCPSGVALVLQHQLHSVAQ